MEEPSDGLALGNEVVHHISCILRANPIDFSIAVLAADPAQLLGKAMRENISRCLVVEEGHFGLEAQALPWITRLIRCVYKEHKKNKSQYDVCSFLETTAALLLVNPDHTTVWADRRRCLLRLSEERPTVTSRSFWTEELRFVNLLMTQHTKAPSSWGHRKYVITKLTDVASHLLDADFFSLARQEIATCRRIAHVYPKNYHAWTHRLWTVKGLCHRIDSSDAGEVQISLLTQLLEDEWQSVVSDWMPTHSSDHSAVHYGCQILKLNLQWVPSFDWKDAIKAVVELVDRHRDYESMWIFRRLATIILCENQLRESNKTLPELEEIISRDVQTVYKNDVVAVNSKPLAMSTRYACAYVFFLLGKFPSLGDRKWMDECARLMAQDERVAPTCWNFASGREFGLDKQTI